MTEGKALALKEIKGIDECDWALTHPPIMSNNEYFLIPLHIHVDQGGQARELLKVHFAPDAL